MAGRFLFQKFSSVSRSTRLLGNQGSASTRAASPVTRTDPAARDFITFTCSHAGAKTSWLLCEMPLVNNSTSATGSHYLRKMLREARRFQAMNKSANTTIVVFAFSGLCWVYMFSNSSSGGRTIHSSNPKME